MLVCTLWLLPIISQVIPHNKMGLIPAVSLWTYYVSVYVKIRIVYPQPEADTVLAHKIYVQQVCALENHVH